MWNLTCGTGHMTHTWDMWPDTLHFFNELLLLFVHVKRFSVSRLQDFLMDHWQLFCPYYDEHQYERCQEKLQTLIEWLQHIAKHYYYCKEQDEVQEKQSKEYVIHKQRDHKEEEEVVKNPVLSLMSLCWMSSFKRRTESKWNERRGTALIVLELLV